MKNVNYGWNYRFIFLSSRGSLARLSKSKSTTRDFAQAIMKTLLNPSHPGGGGGGGGGTLAPAAGFLTAVPKPLWISV